MMTTEREVHVVDGRGGNGAGWFIAGLVIAALLVAAFIVLNGTWMADGGRDIDVQVEIPAAPEAPQAPAAPAPAN